jgi:hypothetical protein
MRELPRIALSVWVVLLAAAALAAGSSNATEATTSLDSILADCGTLNPASQAHRVKDVTVNSGHLEISFADGVAVAIVGRDGETYGVYFEGRGAYRYATPEVGDRQTLALNLSRLSPRLRLMDGAVTDELKRVLVLSSERSFTKLWDPGAAAGAAEPPSASFVKGLRDMLAANQDAFPEFDFRIAEARLNGRGRWISIEMAGGVERVGHVWDEIEMGREAFVNFRTIMDAGVRSAQPLGVQRIPGWKDGRESWLVLTHADISLDTSDNKSGTIVSDMTFHVSGAGTRIIPLKLLSNRNINTARWDSPKYKLNVTGVTDGSGRPVAFKHRYHEILVEIDPNTAAEADVRLHFETGGEVFIDMKGQHADNYFFFEGDPWYPAPRGWAGERFTYTLKVRTKKPWRPVTSGREIELRDDGTYYYATSRSDHPSMLIAVVAGKYVTREETIDGFTVRVHAYSVARKPVIERLPKLAAALVRIYTSQLGPIPAEELDIVEVPEYGFGISPSGLILLTTEAYKPHWDFLTTILAKGINARLAHEIAHQWFGHKAIDATYEDQWLSETFAEYFSALAIGVMAKDEARVVGFPELLAEWRAEAKSCNNGAPIAGANYLGGDSGWRDRFCLLYDRGPLVLHMLRTSMGNERFFSAVASYLDSAAIGPATTDDFARAVSAKVGSNMSWFFDDWYAKGGVAHIQVDDRIDRAAGGQFRLAGRLRQAAGPDFKRLLVPLVWESGGKTEVRIVFDDQPERNFEFLLPAKPGSIKLDPFQNNLATYK